MYIICLWFVIAEEFEESMDLFCGNSNDSQASKVQSLDVSPINSQNFIGRGRFYPGPKTRILNPYASSDSSGSSSNRVLSPLARYLHSSSPVSFASDSPERRSLVNTSSGSRSGSGGGGVFRSPLASIENIEIPTAFRTPVKVEEDVVVMDGILVEPKHGARAKSLPSTSDSGGRLSSSTSGSENSSHMSEVCRWWGDTGTCRFGSKCRVSLFSFFSLSLSQKNMIQCFWNIRALIVRLRSTF